MYAILDIHGTNVVVDFETRNLPLDELVHESFRKYYIEIEESHTLKCGDIWDEKNKSWIIYIPEPDVILEENPNLKEYNLEQPVQ